jgi:hypothetical protein
MKREGVIVTTFTIERQKQVKLFQIKIPREAQNIVGVEMGLKWISGVPAVPEILPLWNLPMTIKRNLNIGELKLQSYEKANIFYTGELVINQNGDTADFTSEYFSPKAYTHQGVSHEDEVQVNGNTTLIQGAFRDKLSEQQEGNYAYKVYVYLWVAVKEDQSNL